MSVQPVYTAGHNRIPDNWYKRNTVDAYTIPYCESYQMRMRKPFP